MQIDPSFTEFVFEIKSKIKAAQYKALYAINQEQINLYWNIGKTIIERQNQHKWGKSVVEMLALELQKEFVDNFTHEFKTPLAVMKIASEVIVQPGIINNPERLFKYGNLIKE